ncbi:type II secretion system protein N [Photobacterium damselae]|uniref:type II secretion system protein N n=1 Tax=Photobacterium damselae TaxID=38293 RepID=UPI001EDFFE22|nr:type II secretion system protein N [Photobacterium damselae]
MKFKLALGASFGAVFIASAIAHIPASWVWQQAPAVPGLTVTGISGTVWQGRADKVSWQQQSFGQAYWDVNVLDLLTAKVSADVRFGQGSDMALRGRGEVGYTLSGGPYAKQLMVSLPAQQALNYAKLPIPLTATGHLELALQEYQFAVPYCKGLTGTLTWSQPKVGTPMGDLALGQAKADLRCVKGNLQASVKQSSADVSSEWSATLDQRQNYQVSGWFKPGANFPTALGSQLKWLGNPDSKGQYRINQQGRL